MIASCKLSEMAKTIRSKNAGVDKITFDVIFPDRATYDLVRNSGVLSREAVCQIFGVAAAQVSDHVEFDPASSSRSTAQRQAGAPATLTFSGVSNMVRCSISRSREVETPQAACLEVGCGEEPTILHCASDGCIAPKSGIPR
jgi:hypothetical protein